MTKSDVTVKLIHPTGNNTLFTLDPSDFELENVSLNTILIDINNFYNFYIIFLGQCC